MPKRNGHWREFVGGHFRSLRYVLLARVDFELSIKQVSHYLLGN